MNRSNANRRKLETSGIKVFRREMDVSVFFQSPKNIKGRKHKSQKERSNRRK